MALICNVRTGVPIELSWKLSTTPKSPVEMYEVSWHPDGNDIMLVIHKYNNFGGKIATPESVHVFNKGDLANLTELITITNDGTENRDGHMYVAVAIEAPRAVAINDTSRVQA